ncbi:MAG: hypothetical protein CMJ78_13575 [Planctomycetaceae bacterium]|nr:hypothetical protein [Planctomycetaceae bacterium]
MIIELSKDSLKVRKLLLLFFSIAILIAKVPGVRAHSYRIFGDRVIASSSGKYAVGLQRVEYCFNSFIEPIGDMRLRFYHDARKRQRSSRASMKVRESGNTIATFQQEACIDADFWKGRSRSCWEISLSSSQIPGQTLVSNRGHVILLDVYGDNESVARNEYPAIRILNKEGKASHIYLKKLAEIKLISWPTYWRADAWVDEVRHELVVGISQVESEEFDYPPVASVFRSINLESCQVTASSLENFQNTIHSHHPNRLLNLLRSLVVVKKPDLQGPIQRLKESSSSIRILKMATKSSPSDREAAEIVDWLNHKPIEKFTSAEYETRAILISHADSWTSREKAFSVALKAYFQHKDAAFLQVMTRHRMEAVKYIRSQYESNDSSKIKRYEDIIKRLSRF